MEMARTTVPREPRARARDEPMLSRSEPLGGADAPARGWSDRRYAAVTAAAVLAVTVLRLAWLAGSPLDLAPDEAQYWLWSQDLAAGYFSKPPMIAWLIQGSTAVCGDAEFCVRWSAPLFHAATALMLFLLGRALYDSRVGLFAALTFVTLPGVSYSSALITTDVPLLFFWSCALFGLHRLLTERRAVWALATGLAIGLGLLSKYAMIYFVGCAVIYCLFTPQARWVLLSRHALIVVVVAAALYAPNLWWNLDNAGVTYGHTADNANLEGPLLHPLEAIEFLGGQLLVFGPILFLVLAVVLARFRWRATGDPTRFLLAFSIPIVALVLVQALLSRAHANWAATAYVGASVLVAGWLVQRGHLRILKASLGLHIVGAVVLSILVLALHDQKLPGKRSPLFMAQGWAALGAAIGEHIAARPDRVLLFDDRKIMASMAYYLRHHDGPMFMWDPDGVPGNHYELRYRFEPDAHNRALYVARYPDPRWVLDTFSTEHFVGTLSVPTGGAGTREVHLYEIAVGAPGDAGSDGAAGTDER